MFRILVLAAACAVTANTSSSQTKPAPIMPNPADPFLWLEDVNGARAMDWVKAENAKTLGVLETDSRYPDLYADALKIAEAGDRIPAPEFLGGQGYNLWRS